MGKKSLLLVAKGAKIGALQKIGFSEREIAKRVHVGKTAIHQDVSKLNISGKYVDLKRSGRLTSRKN